MDLLFFFVILLINQLGLSLLRQLQLNQLLLNQKQLLLKMKRLTVL